jgi:N-acetylmuramoyl-L-alanine amidase
LDGRVQFSEDNDADLFISLHADSIEGKKVAQTVRGATIYTLSDRASDEEARVKAEKENASDLIAGLAPAKSGRSDQVKNILFDLMKRETADFSADFSRTVRKRLGKVTEMSRVPERSAAFKVLKQTHAPSILIELGYISNKSDEREMTTEAWRKKVAAAITSAVETYFKKRTSHHR